MDSLYKILHRLISTTNSTNVLFDELVRLCLEHHDEPVHSLHEMRTKRSTKVKGDLFEAFCVLYLRYKGYQVWLLKDVTDDILIQVGLGRRDVGIDLIAKKDDRYHAIQCKFKRPRPGLIPGTWIAYNCVNWKELSTFFSLCHRTQAQAKWGKLIVMTNTTHCRRMGKATFQDKTYAYGTFAKLTRMDLLRMLHTDIHPDTGEPLRLVIEEDTVMLPNKTVTLTLEEVREARLKRFQ